MIEQKTIKKVIIDRSKWRSGSEGENKTGEGLTKLLNDEGFSCCLGFATKQLCGKIEKVCYPQNLPFLVPELVDYSTSLGRYVDNDFSNYAAVINDNKRLTREERESKLIELFAENDIELVFV